MTVPSIGKNNASPSAPLDVRRNYIFGTGEMADLTRAFDWSRTPVGPIERWPDALLLTVNTLVANRHPTLLLWGPELTQFYNDAFRPSLGDKHPQALGQRGEECWPEIWPVIGPQIEKVMTRGESTWSENQLIAIIRNGRLEDVYWTYSYSPVRDSAGNIRGTLVTCTETTREHMADLRMRQELKRLADLFQQAPAFFTLLRGPQHTFEMINPLYQELLGPRSLIGKTVSEAVPEVEEQGFTRILDGVYRTGVPFIGRNTPIKLARHGSLELEERTLDFVYQPLREVDGTVSGIIVLGVDVTEGRRAEEALLQSEKLAAVGRLASSIAHEINNPLESVTNLLFLARQAAVNVDTRRYLASAEVELRRVSAIANQTLRFYRQATNPKPVTPENLVNDTLPLYQGRLANSQVKLERRDRTCRPVKCLDGEIRQVLSNLIGNAIDSMNAAGGRLMVRSRGATEWATGRRGVVLTVADSGPGIPQETLPRIFEPFFTTKGISGTGLGLWISREIVERHKGTLRVRACYGEGRSGVVFTVFLPFEGETPA